MRQTVNIKVLFTRQNARMCICGQCPVQAKSQCVKENSEKMGDVSTTRFFEPKIMPGLYCAGGTAGCRDIDTSQNCICSGCEVYANNQLDRAAPNNHFCKNGSAR